MKCLSVSALRMGLLLALVSGASSLVARAQIHSSAFDPNCYQPRIGVPGEIDTIYGSYVGQELGGGLINIGPSPQNPGGPGRLMFGGLAGDKAITGRGGAYSVVDCGPNFDMHHMTVAQFKGFWNGSTMVLGHFHSSTQIDVLLTDSLGADAFPKIYWADVNGDFDTSRYTILSFQKPTNKYSLGWMHPPFHAHLSSDTAEDLVFLYNTDNGTDTVRFAQFFGGSSLYQQGKSAIANEEVYFDTMHWYDGNYYPRHTGFIGDFRGQGNEDYLSDDFHGNLFLFKYKSPFDLNEFSRQMREDTLLSVAGDTRLKGIGSSWVSQGLVMKVFSKSAGGNSEDIVLSLDSNGGSSRDGQLRIFRGGPEFGSHRLTIDSAYTIHDPSAMDSITFKYTGWGGLTNCGDMTGTGRPVLCLGGSDDFSFDGFAAFYVLGDAIDEKVDMIFDGYGFSGSFDTCTIDGDGLQDVANGDPGYNVDGKLSGDDKGTVRFIHGSKKIPVHLNRVEVRKTNPALEGAVTVSPNPCSRFTVVTWESSCSGEVHLTLRDLLGKTVYEETRPTTGDLECFRLDLPPLANGEYFLELQQEPCSQIAKIVVKN